MLKKAGIVVAAAAAGLLAVSPLAFAGEGGSHGGGGGGGHGHGNGGGGAGHHDTASSVINDDDDVNNVDQERNQVGLVNINDNEVNVPIQACNNNVLSNIDAAVSVLGILGGGNAAAGGNDNTISGSCGQSNSSGGNILQNISE